MARTLSGLGRVLGKLQTNSTGRKKKIAEFPFFFFFFFFAVLSFQGNNAQSKGKGMVISEKRFTGTVEQISDIKVLTEINLIMRLSNCLGCFM